jgi:hypothetical protein
MRPEGLSTMKRTQSSCVPPGPLSSGHWQTQFPKHCAISEHYATAKNPEALELTSWQQWS